MFGQKHVSSHRMLSFADTVDLGANLVQLTAPLLVTTADGIGHHFLTCSGACCTSSCGLVYHAFMDIPVQKGGKHYQWTRSAMHNLETVVK